MSVSSLKILRRYVYDPLDRLMRIGLLAGDGTERFYQENHLITELGQQTHRTIFRHETQALAQSQNEAGVTETTLLATDQAHSLLKTFSTMSSQQFAYTAYGNHPAESGLSRLIGFNGECPDATTGHYPLGQGNRFFNPVLMRFNSPDKFSPFGKGGINPYVYCLGDPINLIDPSGNGPVPKFIPFRPWEPIKMLDPSSLAIGRQSQAAKNPMLNALLNSSSGSSTPSMSSTSRASTAAANSTPPSAPHTPGISIRPLSETDVLMGNVPIELRNTPEFVNLRYYGDIVDMSKAGSIPIRSNPTATQTKALKSHIAREKFIKDEATKELHFFNLSELLLQIRETSVKKSLNSRRM
ncbi:RHS repeat-associated core domain-containing protein|uniref:RHS repeat-associated core domain-containing protein n=1 Tax=Pseudomonas sp. SbOxS1 TaxID=2723884 RepID=UPI0015D2D20A|nr:RHS repeat-associated core domain-containing protein [Pseudomonas sp. SbOxS1]NYU01219.1 RHS repeat-associated core domain-containing protein [Pseudomonas sp. SbOxS1]